MVITAAGTRFAISGDLPVFATAASYAAIGYTDIAEITDGGGSGRVYETVTQSPLGSREIRFVKSLYSEGTREIFLGADRSDPGQELLERALLSDDAYAFRVTFQDGGIVYFSALVTAATTSIGPADSIVTTSVTLVQQGPSVRA